MSIPQAKLIAKLDELNDQFSQIEKQLSDPEITANHNRVRELSVKRAAMEPIVSRYATFRDLAQQQHEHEEIIEDNSDEELTQLARAELPELREQSESLLEEIANSLVTADDASVGSVILEVRAAAGGDEAALWAGDILEMYQKRAATKRWKFDVLELSAGDVGGVRQIIVNVKGEGVWQQLGYEGGVHCVKRVPATETQGRIHTSTCTVAVLPEPEELDIQIPDSDVQIHITTAQGPGGQNVNKVATAVHMIHTPTGIEVRMQESKSQHQNREKAWALLRARVYDVMQREKEAERAGERAKMIGSGERSERIRTYRYKENIVVDHRLGQSFNLTSLLAGEMDELIDALIAQDRAQRLAAL